MGVGVNEDDVLLIENYDGWLKRNNESIVI